MVLDVEPRLLEPGRYAEGGAWVYGDDKEPAVYGRLDVATKIGAEVSKDPLGVGVGTAASPVRVSPACRLYWAKYLAALDPLLP